MRAGRHFIVAVGEYEPQRCDKKAQGRERFSIWNSVMREHENAAKRFLVALIPLVLGYLQDILTIDKYKKPARYQKKPPSTSFIFGLAIPEQ
jgi:hypothetical protein